MADQVVVRLQQILDPEALDIFVHWDDCDMDEARYWFHFRVPHIRSSTPSSKQAVCVALMIREAWKRVDKELAKPSPFQFAVDRQRAPVGVYEKQDGNKVFRHYDSHTWIYTLAIFG